MEAVAFLQQHYYERFGYPLCWKVCLFPQFFLLMLLLIQSVFHISRKILHPLAVSIRNFYKT